MVSVADGFIAKHTGLPSFAFTGPPGRPYIIDAEDDTGRRWVAVRATGTGGVQSLSDALALPGVPTRYSSRMEPFDVELTRPVTDWWRGLVSRKDGRSIPDMGWVMNQDPRSWSAGVERFNSRIARWPLLDEPVGGEGVFALFDTGRVDEAWRLFMAHEPLYVFPGEIAPSLPPRVVTVDSVAGKRFTRDGWVEFTVKWTELPLDSPLLVGGDGTIGAPVVTWGEWDAHDHAWAARTYLELCQRIAGAP